MEASAPGTQSSSQRLNILLKFICLCIYSKVIGSLKPTQVHLLAHLLSGEIILSSHLCRRQSFKREVLVQRVHSLTSSRLQVFMKGRPHTSRKSALRTLFSLNTNSRGARGSYSRCFGTPCKMELVCHEVPNTHTQKPEYEEMEPLNISSGR